MVARLLTDEAAARRLAHLVDEHFEDTAVSAFEAEGRWAVEVILSGTSDHNAIAELLRSESPDGSPLFFEPLAERDWVAASLVGLKPVRAGRFFIHGAHDRLLVPANAIGIEIEAALAFGTGHHGTTRGCLLALDRVLRSTRPRRVLDVGTGTGILAIAAARAAHAPVTATDIDPVARHATRDNAAFNRVRKWIAVLPAEARLTGVYDLVMANILALPLIEMSDALTRRLAPRGYIVLSGLMPEHARGVVSAYRAHGLSLERRMLLEGWVTLTMRRRG
jgi:ribosomal protein L11 methyltransferase